MIRKLCLGAAAILASSSAAADWELNMPRGVTEMSAETYDLHMMVFWWCVAIAVVVFGAMIYSIFAHRKSKHAEAAQFSHSMKAEVIWTVIPIVILLIMAVPAAETLVKLEDTRDPDITLVVTGYQWKWHYRYQDEGIEFYSNLHRESDRARRLDSGVDPSTVENYLLDVDNRVVVPRGAKVRALITSNDVIHAWWIPDFAIKKDAIPGFVNEVWFRPDETGVYFGRCAELCGKDHGFMPVVVEVVEPEAFETWVAQQQSGQSGNAAVAAAE